MLFWIIQTAVASFIFIFLIHYLINFFKSTLTVPKIKDLVNSPTQKYENIYKIISHNNKPNQYDKKNTEQYDIADLLPTTNVTTSTPIDKNNMKNELKNFLKNQITTQPMSSPPSSSTTSTTNISDLIGSSDLGSSSSGISFSQF